MSNEESQSGSIPYLTQHLLKTYANKEVSAEHLWYAIRGALDPNKLINNLSEALRISSAETIEELKLAGFQDLLVLIENARNESSESSTNSEDSSLIDLEPDQQDASFVARFLHCESSLSNTKGLSVPDALARRIDQLTDAVCDTISTDPFAGLYRQGVKDYFAEFMEGDAVKIRNYVNEHFGSDGPKYLINSGIGANEQSNHLVAALNNARSDRGIEWIIANSPTKLRNLPDDVSVENTLFMEFSRSGKTEETVKIHEYTPRSCRRIVFANQGPLRELGKRDENLVLDLPDQVSGRFGRNKTPILLAPMLLTGQSVEKFWATIESTISEFDLTSKKSLPVALARFIYAHQQYHNSNQIYFGCDDPTLGHSANELIQFWNEGVNKGGNDLSMTGYFGLLRDSHANIEGLMANAKSKIAIFLVADRRAQLKGALPPLVSRDIDALNPSHSHLQYGIEEEVLVEANYVRCSELMPSYKLSMVGDLSLDHAAVLGQLWADVTFFYSRLMNIDPGSNPEVKFVRDRAERLLGKTQ